MNLIVLNWRDLADIALVTLLIYQVILLIRGTRVLSALAGLVVLGAVYLGARELGLTTLTWLLEHLFGSLFLVLVILFHDDIRQALAGMWSQSFWRRKRGSGTGLIDDLVWVCRYFGKRRIGALIVLERKDPLGDMMQGGVKLDALVSRELLLTVFFPKTALHDGAVIIRNKRIAAAGCILPLARLDRQAFGTRHRAALGASEASDAVVVVVSEERGETSVAVRGRLAVMPNSESLKETLTHVLEN